MSIKELMQPRYKVIADFPLCPYKIGHIISVLIVEEDAKFFDKYPHLFRKLEWWEHRKVEEMPKYVKWRNRYVYKVDRYAMSIVNLHALFTTKGRLRSKPVTFLKPATEEEHNEYRQARSA